SPNPSRPSSAASGSTSFDRGGCGSSSASRSSRSPNRSASSRASAERRSTSTVPLGPLVNAAITARLSFRKGTSRSRALHRGPQAVGVHGGHVPLHLLAGAVRDDGLAAVMDVEHELVRLGLWIAEVALEDIGDVAHEVDRVVPHDGGPRPVGLLGDLLLAADVRPVDFNRCAGHHPIFASSESGLTPRIGRLGETYPTRRSTLIVMMTISGGQGSAERSTAATASTALLTDHYELTMLQAALRSGAANRRSVFEVFARRLPDGRRYGVVAGTGRLLDAIATFRFGDEQLAFLERTGVVDRVTLDWLA